VASSRNLQSADFLIPSPGYGHLRRRPQGNHIATSVGRIRKSWPHSERPDVLPVVVNFESGCCACRMRCGWSGVRLLQAALGDRAEHRPNDVGCAVRRELAHVD
jgi:hypothetical protein